MARIYKGSVHYYDHRQPMSEDEKKHRREKRLQAAYLTKLIQLGAGVTVELPGEDGESYSAQIALVKVHRDGYRVYHVPFEGTPAATHGVDLTYTHVGPSTLFAVTLKS